MCNSGGGVETKDRDGESSSIRFSLAEGAVLTGLQQRRR